jgi:hydroxymethylbilane synthase
MPDPSIVIATRGSALALAQAHHVHGLCRAAFPRRGFEIRVIKTTGDKLLTASLARPDPALPKGLFTKELETALLRRRADLAVHSLKDLPTELPAGLALGAVGARADVRDVLIYRDSDGRPTPGARAAGRGFGAGLRLGDLPRGATVASSSTRRCAQVLDQRPDLRVTDIRGNVIRRLQKLAASPALDATLLAAAGLARLGVTIAPEGWLRGEAVPDGLRATILEPEEMLPCVGQGALGIEVRAADRRLRTICRQLDDEPTHRCVAAERAFLSAMGGGCSSPVAAYADFVGARLRVRAVSFRDGPVRRGELRGAPSEAVALGRELAARLTR